MKIILIYILLFVVIPWLISTLYNFLKELMERRRYKIKLRELAPLINQIDVDMLSYKVELLTNDFSQLENKLYNEYKRINYKNELASININKYVTTKKPKRNIGYMRWRRY